MSEIDIAAKTFGYLRILDAYVRACDTLLAAGTHDAAIIQQRRADAVALRAKLAEAARGVVETLP